MANEIAIYRKLNYSRRKLYKDMLVGKWNVVLATLSRRPA